MATESARRESPRLGAELAATWEGAWRALPGHGVPWLAARRQDAIARFAGLGLPSPRDEAWRHTNLVPLTRLELDWSGEARPIDTAAIPDLGLPRLVFVDGRHAPDLDVREGLPEGVVLTTLRALLDEQPDRLRRLLGQAADDAEHPLVALNTAYFQDGPVLLLAAGARLKRPVHVVWACSGAPVARHPRALICAGSGSAGTVVEQAVALGEGPYLSNHLTEVLLEPDARFEHIRLQDEGRQAWSLANLAARVPRDAVLISRSFALGASVARVDHQVHLDGPGAEAALHGLSLAADGQHHDQHVFVDHAHPHGTSRQRFKFALDGRSRGVFTGRVRVMPQAMRTDATQDARHLLLSDQAVANARPELEIFADDVKCAHGSAIGAIEGEPLFYLRSRGLDLREARRLLTLAFATEFVDEVADEAVREALQGRLQAWLDHLGAP